jgi:hypothetical protein
MSCSWLSRMGSGDDRRVPARARSRRVGTSRCSVASTFGPADRQGHKTAMKRPAGLACVPKRSFGTSPPPASIRSAGGRQRRGNP